MKLQIATRIALYAILDLASDPARQLSAADIADRFGISGNHLSKVLRTLGRAGLVEALRGAGGGYRFRANAKRVTLLDVVRLFEDVEPAAGEVRDPDGATPEGRALGVVLEEIDDTARATLSSITLATMLKLVEQERRSLPAAEASRRAVARVAGRE